MILNCLNTTLICTVVFWPIQIRTVQYGLQSDSEVEQSELENTTENQLIDEMQQPEFEILDVIYYIFF